MRGGELQARIKDEERLKEPEAAIIMKELLSTLELCHKNKILHRDIKPRNIILR
jgi:serine/threonine protein kinase